MSPQIAILIFFECCTLSKSIAISRKRYGGVAKFDFEGEVAGMATSASDIAVSAHRLIGALGTSEFVSELDDTLRAVANFDLTAILRFSVNNKPTLLHNGLVGISSPEVMSNYLNGTYLLDAVYASCVGGVESGLYRLSELAPDEFFSSGYYVSPEVHPCISLESGTLAEEIVFIAKSSFQSYICYSLMRSSRFQPFSDSEIFELKQFTPIVNALVMKQWPTTKQHGDTEKYLPKGELEHAFLSFAEASLSHREKTIVSFVLRGHSSLSIAHVLKIAEGTVKNHRKHIYAKLGISSQGELFNLFLNHILGRHV
jgi:DNA-binding CsgD family transcriptional regulator